MIKYFRRLYLKIEHPFILACAMLVSCQIILSMPIEQKSKPLTTLAMVVSTVAGVLFTLSMRKTLKEFEWLQEIVWGVGFGTILLGTYVAIKNCPWWILGVELICGIAIFYYFLVGVYEGIRYAKSRVDRKLPVSEVLTFGTKVLAFIMAIIQTINLVTKLVFEN